MRDRIGYLHVPKAAGTSIGDALRRAIASTASDTDRTVAICPAVMDQSLFGTFDDFESFADHQRSMVVRPPMERLRDFDVVMGHFNADSLRAGRSDDDVAVLLREPRTRLLSLYTFWRSWTEPEHAAWGGYTASRRAVQLPWAEFLGDATIAPQIDNVAARLLLGPHPLIPVDGFIAEESIDRVTTDALEALGRLGFVDVVEHGDASWLRLGQWAQLPLSVVSRNETPDVVLDHLVWQGAREPAALDMLKLRTDVDHQLWLAAATQQGDAGVDLSARAENIASAKFSSFGVTLPALNRPRRPMTRSSRWTRWSKRVRLDR